MKQSILWAIENNKKKKLQFIMIMKESKNGQKKEWKANKKITKEYTKFIDENLN